jgi:hypothetical protein
MPVKTRKLTESFAPTGTLSVDREAGVIRGVRVLGPESRNTHGERGISATEYSAAAHADARRLYEGQIVNLDHMKDKKRRHGVADEFGVLRNVQTTNGADGRPVTEADLHYLKSHEMANRVAEDVERKLVLFSLSHDAVSNRDRIDRTRGRLVIEGLHSVSSVDLVYKAGTNRNLWESEDRPVKITLRSVLESLKTKVVASKGKTAWVRHLLEDDGMTAATIAEADEPTDPDEALSAGVEAAIVAIIRDENMDASAKAKKIAKLLKAHEKLTAEGEPEEPSKEDDAVEKPKTESTDEVAELRRKLDGMEKKDAVRQLCESEHFAPKSNQLTALLALATDADRKALIADLKSATTKPASGARSGFRPVQESQAAGQGAANAKELATALKRR